MKTTLKAIRAHVPCVDGWMELLAHLGKTAADDEPLTIETILDSNGLNDAAWCLRAVKGHDREIRLYAVWCARQVQHLMTDPRSISALDVAERFARGLASDAERVEAAAAARAAARAAAWAAPPAAAAAAAAAAEAAARSATCEAAAPAAAWAATCEAAARQAEVRAKQAEELRRICRDIEAGRDPYPEEDGR